eukprot:1999083-Prymnesium_polylepis.1
MKVALGGSSSAAPLAGGEDAARGSGAGQGGGGRGCGGAGGCPVAGEGEARGGEAAGGGEEACQGGGARAANEAKDTKEKEEFEARVEALRKKNAVAHTGPALTPKAQGYARGLVGGSLGVVARIGGARVRARLPGVACAWAVGW